MVKKKRKGGRRTRAAGLAKKSLRAAANVNPNARAQSKPVSTQVQVPILGFDESHLMDLAVDIWKLEKHLKKAVSLDEHRPLKSALTKLYAYLDSYGIQVQDCLGEKYHEGMNVKVLSFVEDNSTDAPFVSDVIKPAILINGQLISHASVVINTPVCTESSEHEAPSKRPGTSMVEPEETAAPQTKFPEPESEENSLPEKEAEVESISARIASEAQHEQCAVPTTSAD